MSHLIAKPVKRINVEDAKIKTATVEIKALTINAKQMTLSVFRQIQEESIIDEDTLQLKGVAWGKVNYFWKDQEGAINILWQKENELRRCVDGYFNYKNEIELFERLKEILLNEIIEGSVNIFISHSRYSLLNLFDSLKIQDMKTISLPLPEKIKHTSSPPPQEYISDLPDDFNERDLWWQYEWEKNNKSESYKQWKEEEYKQKNKVCEMNQSRINVEKYRLYSRILIKAWNNVQSRINYVKKRNDLVAQLEQLDQLFIAV